MRSGVAKYAALTLGVVVLAGALLSLVFHGPGDRQSIGISGVVAVVVQLVAFSLSRLVAHAGLMARMGIGSLVRLFALVTYALLVVLVIKIPAVAALISLALFFFLSTVLEPLLIKS